MAFTELTNDVETLGPDAGGAKGFEAAEDVIAGQVVKLDGDEVVEPSDTDGEEAYGVATQTVAAGDMVQVAGPGTVVRFSAGASVSSGAIASHGGTGDEGEVADAATGDYIVGFAHESGSDGDSVIGIVSPSGQVN